MLVVDKTGVAAGASGIACGVVRNNYFQPAMSELMAACVEIWESDPETLAYHGSGYIALGDGAQVERPHDGPRAPAADRLPVAAHPRRGRGRGAHALAVRRLARPGAERLPARARGRLRLQPRLDARPRVQGARGGRARSRRASRSPASSSTASGAVTRVQTSAGPIAVEQVVVAVGPWIATAVGDARAAARRLEVAGDGARRCGRTGTCRRARSTSTRRCSSPTTARCPRCSTSTATRRCTTTTARLVTDEQWGIYFKQDKHSVQGGASPLPKGHEFELDPYPTGTVEPGLPRPLVRGALALHGALRGLPPALPPGALGRRRAPSPPTTSRSSTTCARTSSWPPTPTTATR